MRQAFSRFLIIQKQSSVTLARAASDFIGSETRASQRHRPYISKHYCFTNKKVILYPEGVVQCGI